MAALETPVAPPVAQAGDETDLRRPEVGVRFWQGFTWTWGANVLYAACQWGMLAVLAKLCGPAEVGSFALGLAVTAPVVLFSNLQLRAVLATDARGSFHFGEYVRLRLWTTVAALLAIAGIAVAQPRSGTAALIVLVVGISKSFESMSDILHGYLQKHERMDVVARSLILKGGVAIVLVVIATAVLRSALAAAAALGGASALVLAFYDWPVTRRFRAGVRAARTPSPVRLSRLCRLAGTALPLGIVQGLVSLGANVPRYHLERSAGLAELGIFSALASLILVGQTMVNALGNVASPRLAQKYAAGDFAGFVRLLLFVTASGASLGIAGVGVAALYGGPLLSLLFRPEYGEHSGALVIVMAGAIFAYAAWSAGYGLTAARLFRVQIPLLGTVCVVAWAASALFVPTYGVVGGAMAFAASMAAQAVGAALILWRVLLRRAEAAQ